MVETWIVATGLIFSYIIFTIVIGFVANKALAVDMEDFLLYGRKAGFVVLYLSVVATYHSAFAFLGSSGFFYTHGIGFWEAGTWTVLVGAITYTLGVRIWALGKKFSYMTPADMLADFYESELLRVIVALVSVCFTILYIQVQAQGLGYIISVASGDRISFELGTFVLLVVASGYLMAGGLRAVYWTDVIQGVWMYVAVWAGGLVLSYRLFGGPLNLWKEVREVRPDLLTLPGPEGFFSPGMWIGMTIALSFGIILQPHIMIRYYTAASGQTIKWLGATTPIFLLTLYIPTALVGLGGAVVLPGLDNPDQIFPEMLFRYAPAWLSGLILAGATAAAMSTLDLVIGYILSVKTFSFLVTLVALSGSGALQLLPAMLGVCYPVQRPFTRNGVLMGMLFGFIVLYWALVVSPNPLGIHAALWSLGFNLLVCMVVSRFTQPPSETTVNRIHGTLEEYIYGSGEISLEKS